MRLVIDILDAADAERAVALLRGEGIAVHVGGDGGPALPTPGSEHGEEAFIDALRQFRGVIPPGYALDRDDLHDRDA